jgi:signal transduction histidine kinase
MDEKTRQEIESNPIFRQRLEAENLGLLISRTRYALLAAFFVYTGFWFLDRITSPENQYIFLVIRLCVVAGYLVAYLLLRTDLGSRIAIYLSVGVVYISALGIALMIPYIGGFKSGYYIGIMMALFVAGLFMPWDVKSTIVCGVLILASYFGINLIRQPLDEAALIQASQPFFFMSGSFLFTIWANREKEASRRTDLLQRMQLEKAAEDLKALDETKTRFFSNVSHELRSPLMMILGPVETMIQESPGGDKQRLLEAVEANARRLLRTVNGLLDFAKLDAGKLKCKYTEGNVGQLLESLVKAAQPLAERRGISLTLEGHESIPDSVFDENKVETIAANLISNAMKFTQEKGSIAVRASFDEARIRFEVADTGCGIPADQLESIFQRFVQVDDALTRKTGGGTGLGLAMVKELSEIHQGRVAVESELGKGSVFKVELPRQPDLDSLNRRQNVGRRKSDQMADVRTKSMLALHYDEKASMRILLSDVLASKLAIQAGKGEAALQQAPADAPRILYVEDNPDMRAFVGRALSKTFRMGLAVDGVDGLEAAQRQIPDLIVTDVMMPRMDGYEFCRQIRTKTEFAKVPIIIVSAEFGTDKIVKGLEVGASDFVQKPFEMRELQARIQAHLRMVGLEKSLQDRDLRLSAIGNMTSSIVHDLKNPLSNIIMYTQLAKADALSEGNSASVEDLETVILESKRLGLMIAEVLDFARGRISELNLQQTALKPFLESTCVLMANQLSNHGISLAFEHNADELLEIMLDRARTQRVFENLIKNSREAILSSPGGGLNRHIWVSTHQHDNSVVIRVADDGPGIPWEIASTLFEPFASHGKKSGTGLGLAIARSLVRAQGGEITIETLGSQGGASFIIKFPLQAAEGSAPGSIQSAPPAQLSLN